MAPVLDVSLGLTVLMTSCVFFALADKPCGQLPPGLEHIFHGVDITTADLYAFEVNKNTLSGLRGGLFKLSCNKTHTWINGTAHYSVPDQVGTFTDKLPPTANIDVKTCSQLYSYKKLLVQQIRLDSVPETQLRGTMSDTDRFRHAQVYLLTNKFVFGEVFNEIHVFLATLSSADDLRSSLVLEIPQEMNEYTYQEKPEPFDKFIDQFGTHYFSDGLFGVRHSETTAIKPEYFFSMSNGNITDSLRAHFLKQFNKLNSNFMRNSRATPHQFGQLQQPWLLKGALKPIANLLAEGHAKRQLESATAARIARAALVEWKRDLELIQKVQTISWFLVGAFTPYSIISRIDSCLSETVPDPNEVNQIGTLVETMVHFVSKMHDHTLKP